MCDNLCGYKLKKRFFMLLVEILNFWFLSLCYMAIDWTRENVDQSYQTDAKNKTSTSLK